MPACRRHGRLPLESGILLRAIGLANSLAGLDPSTELLAHPRHEAVLVDGREIFSLASNSAKRPCVGANQLRKQPRALFLTERQESLRAISGSVAITSWRRLRR